MRVWIDLTNSPHVPVLAPIIRLLREDGHRVDVTTRRYAQTVELAALFELDATVIGSHGGRSRGGKAAAAGRRTATLLRWARERRFDWSLGHSSTDQPLVSRLLRVPATTMFDFEFADLQHHLNCRMATRVVVPDAIPPARLRRFGVDDVKLRRYPGLKEEYYLSTFVPDPAVADGLRGGSSLLVVVRPPATNALYLRGGDPLFDDVLDRLSRHGDLTAVVLPRTPEQGKAIAARGLPRIVVAEHALDGASLVAGADLVISAGGTMNREAVALGTPVYTTFAGRLGAVDEALIADGRLRRLTDAAKIEIARRPATGDRIRRDVRDLLPLLVCARTGTESGGVY